MSSYSVPLRGGKAMASVNVTFRRFFSVRTLQGVLAIAAFVAAWQVVIELGVPYLSNLPYPMDVARSMTKSVASVKYWLDWKASLIRVFIGFSLAQLIGVPLGLAMGVRRSVRDLVFPVFETVRPIPPIAWIPLAILFWPTEELSIYFLCFIGPFFVIVLNVMQGVSNIDAELKRAALSLGAGQQDIFWKIMVPGSLPSIVTGMTVGIGVTWNILIAAEMIAGHGGLGRMTWEAYTNGNIPLIIVGMISIGVAGYVSSGLVRALGDRAMPWKRRF
ncbi:MAG: ABC transporter permease [Thermodesulfovibrionales bacterium]